MNTSMETSMQVTAHFGATAAPVTTSLTGGMARTIAFSAPVRLGAEDVVAALWLYARVGVEAEELQDPGVVRELVAGQILNGGLLGIDEARAHMRALRPGSLEHDWALQIRAAALCAFAPMLDAVPPPRTGGRPADLVAGGAR